VTEAEDNDRLVVVGDFLNRIDADVARSALEASGIESFVSADDAGGVQPGLWMEGVRLLVLEADADRARAVLNEEPQEPHDP
jgi:Putative prokaryotic signal transducing protein